MPLHIPADIYSFLVMGIDGNTIDLSVYRGKKMLIVNTASFCGHTPQYEQLEQLYEQYHDGLVILGFPSNDFLFQEPLSNRKIAMFCSSRFGVTFPMAAKVHVKGNKKAPIYHWLTEKQYNGHADSEVKWNFQKYLVDEKGRLTHIFAPEMAPTDTAIIAAIETPAAE
ncbi:glutathione peroxidase [Nemorincola caseinilytica]